MESYKPPLDNNSDGESSEHEKTIAILTTQNNKLVGNSNQYVRLFEQHMKLENKHNDLVGTNEELKESCNNLSIDNAQLRSIVDNTLTLNTLEKLNYLVGLDESVKFNIIRIIDRQYKDIQNSNVLIKMKTAYNNLVTLRDSGIMCNDSIENSIVELKEKIELYENFM